MNERIKELAEQAGSKVMERNGWTDYGTLDLDVEKFAELIVLECAKVCDEMDIEYGGEDVLATWCAEKIKKHFGVK